MLFIRKVGQQGVAELAHGRDQLRHAIRVVDEGDQASLKALLQRLAARLNDLDPVASACDIIEDLHAA